MMAHQYIGYAVILPLAGFLFNGLLGRKLKSETLVGVIGSATVGIGFLIAVATFIEMLGNSPD